ncbi:MAG: hypothetical protein JHC93_07145 [Parachlamydiales bacterium]|nr:hypothetical protein [Parachlamydiales bacterium]
MEKIINIASEEHDAQRLFIKICNWLNSQIEVNYKVIDSSTKPNIIYILNLLKVVCSTSPDFSILNISCAQARLQTDISSLSKEHKNKLLKFYEKHFALEDTFKIVMLDVNDYINYICNQALNSKFYLKLLVNIFEYARINKNIIDVFDNKTPEKNLKLFNLLIEDCMITGIDIVGEGWFKQSAFCVEDLMSYYTNKLAITQKDEYAQVLCYLFNEYILNQTIECRWVLTTLKAIMSFDLKNMKFFINEFLQIIECGSFNPTFKTHCLISAHFKKIYEAQPLTLTLDNSEVFNKIECQYILVSRLIARNFEKSCKIDALELLEMINEALNFYRLTHLGLNNQYLRRPTWDVEGRLLNNLRDSLLAIDSSIEKTKDIVKNLLSSKATELKDYKTELMKYIFEYFDMRIDSVQRSGLEEFDSRLIFQYLVFADFNAFSITLKNYKSSLLQAPLSSKLTDLLKNDIDAVTIYIDSVQPLSFELHHIIKSLFCIFESRFLKFLGSKENVHEDFKILSHHLREVCEEIEAHKEFTSLSMLYENLSIKLMISLIREINSSTINTVRFLELLKLFLKSNDQSDHQLTFRNTCLIPALDELFNKKNALIEYCLGYLLQFNKCLKQQQIAAFYKKLNELPQNNVAKLFKGQSLKLPLLPAHLNSGTTNINILPLEKIDFNLSVNNLLYQDYLTLLATREDLSIKTNKVVKLFKNYIDCTAANFFNKKRLLTICILLGRFDDCKSEAPILFYTLSQYIRLHHEDPPILDQIEYIIKLLVKPGMILKNESFIDKFDIEELQYFDKGLALLFKKHETNARNLLLKNSFTIPLTQFVIKNLDELKQEQCLSLAYSFLTHIVPEYLNFKNSLDDSTSHDLLTQYIQVITCVKQIEIKHPNKAINDWIKTIVDKILDFQPTMVFTNTLNILRT